jgi:hypothetical protein
LDQLEGGTGAVALLFGEMVVFIQTRFRVLRKESASCAWAWAWTTEREMLDLPSCR